ncbi:MAG: fluoride efflux transporter CrcB [bacterium]|nr:fluoride efflux transporter CrcB [bacterium]
MPSPGPRDPAVMRAGVIRRLAAIAAGGSLGALARFAFSRWTQARTGGLFPWGTLVINLTGCFGIGLLFGFFENIVVSPSVRAFLLIGFLGAFTTFSTYSIETINLLRDGEVRFAVFNVLLNNGLGLALTLVGWWTARIVLRFLR